MKPLKTADEEDTRVKEVTDAPDLEALGGSSKLVRSLSTIGMLYSDETDQRIYNLSYTQFLHQHPTKTWTGQTGCGNLKVRPRNVIRVRCRKRRSVPQSIRALRTGSMKFISLVRRALAGQRGLLLLAGTPILEETSGESMSTPVGWSHLSSA